VPPISSINPASKACLPVKTRPSKTVLPVFLILSPLLSWTKPLKNSKESAIDSLITRSTAGFGFSKGEGLPLSGEDL